MRWNLLLIAVLLSMICLMVGSCTEDDPDSGRARPGDVQATPGGGGHPGNAGDATTDSGSSGDSNPSVDDVLDGDE